MLGEGEKEAQLRLQGAKKSHSTGRVSPNCATLETNVEALFKVNGKG
jgi:hypothetical protein